MTFSSSIPPLLQRIYQRRSIKHEQELCCDLKALHSYHALKEVNKAAERLLSALEHQQNIVIIGDFDVDGATSTALAVKALRAFGALNVYYLIPNRFTYGYGLTPEIVDLAKQYDPHLIITVDNGISSHAGVDRAYELQIDVIVTDHHLPGRELPKAYAIVNPNQPQDAFLSKCMAGVGVIFYVMLTLRAALKSRHWFSDQGITCPNMASLLDLVALGTVCDVVPLDQNNRILVYQGLKRMRQRLVCPGIDALLAIGKRNLEEVVASDLGFVVGPRLNAAGRLSDMSLGVACLLSEDDKTARAMAAQLDALNQQRKRIEGSMKQQACDIVDQIQMQSRLPLGVCLYNPDWHQGVIGLVASRLKEQYHRPVIAFAKIDEQTIKGSARSIEGFHIRNALENIATTYPKLLSKFGGHAMAAGISLHINDFDTFKRAFEQETERLLTEDDCFASIESDGQLTREELTLPTAELLRYHMPWGQGFPAPVFDGVFQLVDQRLISGKHLKLTLKLEQGATYYEAIAFNVNLDQWPNYQCEKVHIAYKLEVSSYQGCRKMQLWVEHIF